MNDEQSKNEEHTFDEKHFEDRGKEQVKSIGHSPSVEKASTSNHGETTTTLPTINQSTTIIDRKLSFSKEKFTMPSSGEELEISTVENEDSESFRESESRSLSFDDYDLSFDNYDLSNEIIYEPNGKEIESKHVEKVS